MSKRTVLVFLLSAAMCLLPQLSIAQPKGNFRLDDKDVSIVIGARTPDQLAAFYTGRGFNRASIDAITATCFVFAIIKNKTYEAFWLDLDDWQFTAADGKPIRRISLDEWKNTWQETGLSKAHQSTFRWTQLPGSRDLRKHEHVGGNVAVEWQKKPFSLVATFRTGHDKAGPPRTIKVENLTCVPR
jgi:hypothetical protein